MRASIEKSPAFAVAALHKNELPAAHGTRQEITRAPQLRLMAQIQPSTVENARSLSRQHIGVDKRMSIDHERAAFAVFYDEWIGDLRDRYIH